MILMGWLGKFSTLFIMINHYCDHVLGGQCSCCTGWRSDHDPAGMPGEVWSSLRHNTRPGGGRCFHDSFWWVQGSLRYGVALVDISFSAILLAYIDFDHHKFLSLESLRELASTGQRKITPKHFTLNWSGWKFRVNALYPDCPFSVSKGNLLPVKRYLQYIYTHRNLQGQIVRVLAD